MSVVELVWGGSATDGATQSILPYCNLIIPGWENMNVLVHNMNIFVLNVKKPVLNMTLFVNYIISIVLNQFIFFKADLLKPGLSYKQRCLYN